MLAFLMHHINIDKQANEIPFDRDKAKDQAKDKEKDKMLKRANMQGFETLHNLFLRPLGPDNDM